MLTALLPHGVYMVHAWMTHGLQGRADVVQHGLYLIYINKVAIQQGLLVEFFCDPHINSLLRTLLSCIMIGLCVQWLPQHTTCRSTVYSLKLKSSRIYIYIYIYIYWIIFICSSNVFYNFITNSLLFQACFLSNNNIFYTC